MNPFKKLFAKTEATGETLKKIDDLIEVTKASAEVLKVNAELSEANLKATDSNQIVIGELVKALSTLTDVVSTIHKEVKQQTELLTTFYVMYDEMLYHIESAAGVKPKQTVSSSSTSLFDVKGKTPPKGNSSN